MSDYTDLLNRVGNARAKDWTNNRKLNFSVNPRARLMEEAEAAIREQAVEIKMLTAERDALREALDICEDRKKTAEWLVRELQKPWTDAALSAKEDAQ
jgi:predicted RNase H-related nuclease YkuK (DUF458 family)